MDKDINLVELLKNAPKGTKLWSPICGECELCKEDLTCKTFPIVCIGIDDGLEWHFKADGSFTENTGVECLLFPSKENRDWSTFKVPQKHKNFEPFQKVLIPNIIGNAYYWFANLYSHYDKEHKVHVLIDSETINTDDRILSYKGNEDKLGKPVE